MSVFVVFFLAAQPGIGDQGERRHFYFLRKTQMGTGLGCGCQRGELDQSKISLVKDLGGRFDSISLRSLCLCTGSSI